MENAAKEGERTVDIGTQQRGNIERNVSDFPLIVTNLSTQSMEICNIVDTIVDIAQQTNLLALNSTIDAVRGGEEDHSLIEVVDEVGKLAEQSQKATKEIAELIITIQGDIDEAIQAMHMGTNKVKVGTKVLNHAGQAFHQAASTVESIAVQIHEIAHVVQQIVASSQRKIPTIQHVTEINENAEMETNPKPISVAIQEKSNLMAKMTELLHDIMQCYIKYRR